MTRNFRMVLFIVFVFVKFLLSGNIDVKKRDKIFVPSGYYFVGKNDYFDNKPVRKIKVKSFFIDIHPVTNIEYLKFYRKYKTNLTEKLDENLLEEKPYLPVTNIYWESAMKYCEANGERLPTEWEWEIAATGAIKRKDYYLKKSFYNKIGNFLWRKIYKVQRVMLYPPNEIGFYDFYGNIFEWTKSFYPKKFVFGRYRKKPLVVLKGCAWTCNYFQAHPSLRTPFPQNKRLPWIGFRCVKEGKNVKKE